MSIESTIGDWILRSVSFSASRALRAQKKIYRGEVTIPYWRIDRGRGQWLVNLPGFADEKESFFPTALQLRNDFNFLLPETLGFGESPRDASLPYRVENYARWIIAFLRECAPEKVWLVGNSLGSHCIPGRSRGSGIAPRMHPGRVRELFIPVAILPTRSDRVKIHLW